MSDTPADGVERVEFTRDELEQVERALADFLAPHLNPQIRGADPDDEGIPEMESALDTVQSSLQDGDTQEDFPEVVCLCGSTRFKDEYRAENRRLTMDGKIVLSVGLFGHADDVDLSDDEKEMLDELHKRKIDLADRVHVVHVDGYVGDSTVSEIDYAKKNDVPVTWRDGGGRSR